jgi:O-antigen ligase
MKPVRPFKYLRIDEHLYLAFLAVLPIVYPLRFKFSGLVVPTADFLFAGAAGAWLISLARGKARIRRSWFYLPLALYLAALVCSTVASVDPSHSAIKLVGKVYLILIAVLTFNLVTSLAFMRRAAEMWQIGTVVTVVSSILGIILFYAGFSGRYNFVLHTYGSLPRGRYPRIDGFFEYAAMLCNYLEISFVIGVIMLSAGWLKARWSWALISGIWITAAFTMTPGLGGLALITGLWGYLKRMKRPRLSKLALAGGVAMALAFFIAASVTLFSYNPKGAEVPLAHGHIKPSHRARAWQTAFETFKQHPLLGRGVGMEVSSARFINVNGQPERLTDAHNTYLSVAGETGLLGFLALGGILVFLLKGVLPSGDSSLSDVIKTYLVLGLIGAFFYEGLVGSFEDARHIWVLFGLIVAVKEGWRDQSPSVEKVQA